MAKKLTKRERLPHVKAPLPNVGVKDASWGEDGDLPATPEKYGARPSKATTCKSCGHAYIDPCNDNEKRKAKCGNWHFILQQKKVKKK